MGSSPFARHYSGSRDFFPFLRLLRCFTSPACLHPPYVFRRGYARITTRGFPHSEIRGSKVVQHLTAAYRSRPRPSSAPDAKASTACPSYLDDRAHLHAAMQFSRYAPESRRIDDPPRLLELRNEGEPRDGLGGSAFAGAPRTAPRRALPGAPSKLSSMPPEAHATESAFHEPLPFTRHWLARLESSFRAGPGLSTFVFPGHALPVS